MKKYYALETTGTTADLYIFGDITSWPWDEKDKDAYSIVKELMNLTADVVNVHINSYGGDVAEGLAIYNTLKNSQKKIITYCDGFACSAASVIFMAGEERVINNASLLMIHNAWTWAAGDSNELRKQADDLEKITSASVKAYMEKVNLSEEEVISLMDKETWITAEEAVAWGFATKTETKKEDGVNQSAMKLIREKMLEPMAMLETVDFDVEKFADLIAEKVKIKTKSEPKKENSFKNFFM